MNCLTYVFSCLIKLEKLLCLKNLGNKTLANSGGFQTIKLLSFSLHETILSDETSSTISYVFAMNGGSALELPWPSSIVNSKIFQHSTQIRTKLHYVNTITNPSSQHPTTYTKIIVLTSLPSILSSPLSFYTTYNESNFQNSAKHSTRIKSHKKTIHFPQILTQKVNQIPPNSTTFLLESYRSL